MSVTYRVQPQAIVYDRKSECDTHEAADDGFLMWKLIY